MRTLMSIVTLVAVGMISGCSTLLVSGGVTEEELVPPGATKAQIEEKLGSPIGREALNDPGSSAIEEVSYRYVGLVKKKGNVGDTIGANLMTFGLAELEMAPKAIRESNREHTVIVRFDRYGNAINHWVLDGPPGSLIRQTK